MTRDLTSRQERALPARSDAGQNRLRDPDRLWSDWKILAGQHPHLHAPQAAALMDVPEAALVAARIGSGAVQLSADIASLLSPISGWGRVLWAGSNAAGVVMPLGHATIRRDMQCLTVSSNGFVGQIDPETVRYAYLFENHDDNHGHSKSLQFFDAAGAAILKVFIFHKTRFNTAKDHFLAFTSASQAQTFSPSCPETSAFDAERGSTRTDPDEASLTGDVRAVVAAELSHGGTVELEHISECARIVWTGQPVTPRFDDTMFHFHQADLRAHLRYEPITRMTRTVSGALALTARNGRLLKISRKAAT